MNRRSLGTFPNRCAMGVVLIGDNEGGRKEYHKLEKLPVLEYGHMLV